MSILQSGPKQKTREWGLFLGLLVLGTLLTSCATLSEKQCKNGDWKTLGYSDGEQGYPTSRFQSHVEACADYQVKPDATAYRAGREEGLKQYCTPDRGLTEGRAGHTYHGVCPASLQKDFLPKYRVGKTMFDLRKRIDNLQNKIEREQSLDSSFMGDSPIAKSRESQIRKMEKEKKRLEAELLALEGVNLVQDILK